MYKGKLNKKLMLVSILVFTVLYSMLTSAVFADSSTNVLHTGVQITGSGAGSWTDVTADCTTFSGTVSAYKQSSNNYTEQTETLTFTNNNEATATIVLEYYLSSTDGSASVDGENVTATNEDSPQRKVVTLAKDKSFAIELKSGSGTSEKKETINVTKFEISLETTISITLQKPLYGSYTVSASDGTTPVTMTPESDDTSFKVASTAVLTLTSSDPVSGYKFDCWMDGNGNVTSYKDGDTFESVYKADSTIVAQFIPSECNRALTVGNTSYYSWEEAMDAAVSSGKPVILTMESHTLPATEAEAKALYEKLPNKDENVQYVELVSKNGTNYVRYIIPKGVTFGIPYDSSFSLEDSRENTSTATVGKPAYTLTVKAGSELIVRDGATFIVNAKRTCSGTVNQGVTTGNYGKLVMGGTMTLESGSKSYIRGYVTDTNHKEHTYGNGTGAILAKSGSYTEILFQVLNFRGGSATSSIIGETSKKVMPITNYSVSNVMMHAEIENGAKVCAAYNFSVSAFGSIAYFNGLVNLIAPTGTANTLFVTSNDAVAELDYDYATDRMYFVAKQGSLNIENVKLEFKVAGILPVTVNSSSLVLPVPDNMQIYVGTPGATSETPTATVTIPNSMKLLPGASIHVMENGVLNLSSDFYMYADEDYDNNWSYGTYRKSLFISETFEQKKAGATSVSRIIVDEDSAIYLNGVLNVTNTMHQSKKADQNRADKSNRIIPIGANAVLNLQALGQDGITLYEVTQTDTDPNYIPNTDWTVIDGLFAGSTEYAPFSSNGVYKVADQGGQYKWYNYKVTYEFEDEAEKKITGLLTEEQNPVYVVGNSTTFAASSLAGGNYVIKGYTIKDSNGADITATSTVAAGETDPNKNNPVSYGWENITLSNLTGDVTVILTVAPYDNCVNWTAKAKGSSADASVWTDYVKDTSRYTPNVDTPCVFELTSPITAVNGTVDGIKTNTEYTTDAEGATTSTFEISGITADINVSVEYNSSTCKVTWIVTDWNGNTTSIPEYVSNGGTARFEENQPDNVWHIITDYTVTNTVDTVNSSDTVLELVGVNDTTEVTITLAEYDYCVSVTGNTSLVDSPNVVLAPRYFNKGESLEIGGNDFIEGKRFIFTKVTPDTLQYEVTPEVLTITAPDSGAKSIAVLVELDLYDYKVVVKNAKETLSTQYIDGNSASYTFANGVYVQGYTTSGTANVSLVNPSLTTAATLNVSEIESDITVTATTAAYDHILKFVDKDGNQLGNLQYIAGDSHTYTIAENDLHYILAASVISDSADGAATLGDVGGKSLDITNISRNPTIQLTLQDYLYKVIWKDSNDRTLQTDYIVENQHETSYTCAGDNVAKLVSVGATVGSQHTVSTADNKTYSVTNISGDMTIKLQLIPYDHVVTIEVTTDNGTDEPATDVTTWYVKDNEDVLNGGGIYYQVGSKQYISSYTCSHPESVDSSSEVNTNEKIEDGGWERIDLVDIKDDVSLEVEVKPYDYKVKWNVTQTVDNVTQPTKTTLHYVTAGATDSCSVDDGLSIDRNATKIKSGNGALTIDGTTVSIPDIQGNFTVDVVARDFLHEIKWVYTLAGETHEDVKTYQSGDMGADGTVTWTVPDNSPDGKTYVITGASLTGCTATHTNKTITVTPTAPAVVVNIELEIAETNYQTLWGTMTYKYYKNGAFYSKVEDGETYKWKLVDSYAWTPKAGSIVTYIDGVRYTVPNGSVMVINPTNQKITATITVKMNNYAEEDWVKAPTMTLTVTDKDGKIVGEPKTTVNGEVVLEITLNAGDYFTITGTMEGTPVDAAILDNVEAGSWTVVMKPLD